MKKTLVRIVSVIFAAGLIFTGCGINKDATFATLGEKSIPLGFANFVARYQQATYDRAYIMYMGEDYWTQDLYGSGNDMEADVKEVVAEAIQEMYVLDEHKGDYGVDVTEAEMNDITAAAKSFMEINYAKSLREIGATEDYIIEYLRLSSISSKMEKAVKDSLTVDLTMEDAAQKAITFVTINYVRHYDEDYNSVEYTEEEAAELKKTAEAIAASDDLEAACEAAGYAANPSTFGDDDNMLPDVVKEAVSGMKVKETSGVLSDDTNYYVVRYDSEYDEEATKSHLDDLIKNEKNDRYTEIVEDWCSAVTWKVDDEQWAKVKFDVLFKEPEANAAE